MGLPAFQTVDFALDSEIVDSLLQMFVNIVVIRVTSPDLLLGAMWCFQQPIRHNLLLVGNPVQRALSCLAHFLELSGTCLLIPNGFEFRCPVLNGHFS